MTTGKKTLVVPFVPNVRPGYVAQDSAQQLTQYIALWRKDGWEFIRLENVTTYVNSGCLGSLFGSGSTLTSVQVAVLEGPDDDADETTPTPPPAGAAEAKP